MLPELPPRWASWAEANARHGEGQAQEETMWTRMTLQDKLLDGC